MAHLRVQEFTDQAVPSHPARGHCDTRVSRYRSRYVWPNGLVRLDFVPRCPRLGPGRGASPSNGSLSFKQVTRYRWSFGSSLWPGSSTHNTS